MINVEMLLIFWKDYLLKHTLKQAWELTVVVSLIIEIIALKWFILVPIWTLLSKSLLAYRLIKN